MPVVHCPIPNCNYETADLSDAIVAALITAHCTIHSAAGVTHRVEKVKRPTIKAAGSSEEWSYFSTRWDDYLSATGITGQEAVVQLLECCEDNLRKDLTRSAGGTLLNKTLNQVLGAIKSLAVREENVMVARVTLHNMRQDRDEAVRSFGARLRGQAGICKFTVNCPTCNLDVDYTEPILRDVLTRGIEDNEIQLELLGNTQQDMTLEQVFQFVETKESGKRSASLLVNSQSTDASSSYKQNVVTQLRRKHIEQAVGKSNTAQNKPKDLFDGSSQCQYCGKTGHGKRAFANVRRSECSATLYLLQASKPFCICL